MAAKSSIVFGTDGWRGLIARDFTFDNVERVAAASAKFFLKEKGHARGVVIGYDARFLSKEFAETTARVLASAGLVVHLSDGICTTPMVSLAVAKRKCAGGVVITASHNPAVYNGFKLKGGHGGPSTPEQVAQVESLLGGKYVIDKDLKPLQEFVDANRVRMFNAKEMYYEYLPTKLNLDAIRASGLRIIYDPMYGAGINTFDAIIPGATQLHNEYNPSFGDLDHPEPMAEFLGTLLKTVRSDRAWDVGLATDGDADRLGAVDEDGNFVDAHHLFVLTLKYLYETKGLRGEVVKTVSLTSMVDDYCKKHKIKLRETPVGFKYISELMTTENVLIGGEESGGYATSLHIPERDGIFNGLLLCEMLAASGKSLGAMVRELHDEFGVHRYKRIDMRTTQEHKTRVLTRAKKGVMTLGRYVVRSTNTLDGYKFMVDGGWLLIRASGTEPLLRFYAEGKTGRQVEELLDAGKAL